MQAVECFEIVHRLGGVVIAKPPEPVGPFTGRQLQLGFGQGVRVQASTGHRLVKVMLGLRQDIPAAVFVAVANPGGKGAVHPTAGNQGWQYLALRLLPEKVLECCHLNTGVLGYGAIETTEKMVGVFRIILPGVFAIEDDRHCTVAPIRAAVADLLEVMYQVIDRVIGVPLGIVKADQTIELHAEMGGTVTAILVKEGQNVSKGQILATLDSDVIDNSVLQLKTQLSLATTTFERQARLWEQNIGSEIQYLQAKAQKEGLENSVKSLRAQARKMKIIAPFSGIIDQIYAKTGELTSPQKPFLKLVNLSKVYVESEVTETYLKSIKKGTAVLLNFRSIGQTTEAKISQVGNFINPNNRSFKTRIDLKNPENELKANLLADIKINDFRANGVVIPSRLVQKDRDNKTFVYTIEPRENNHKIVKTYVTSTMSYDNQSYISEGLDSNSVLVDKGARLVNNNEDVTLLQQ